MFISVELLHVYYVNFSFRLYCSLGVWTASFEYYQYTNPNFQSYVHYVNYHSFEKMRIKAITTRYAKKANKFQNSFEDWFNYTNFDRKVLHLSLITIVCFHCWDLKDSYKTRSEGEVGTFNVMFVRESVMAPDTKLNL